MQYDFWLHFLTIACISVAADYDIEDFYNRTAHRFEDLVQHCTWKGSVCNGSSWEMDMTHYGRCYSFNTAGDHQLLKAGAGIRFTLHHCVLL